MISCFPTTPLVFHWCLHVYNKNKISLHAQHISKSELTTTYAEGSKNCSLPSSVFCNICYVLMEDNFAFKIYMHFVHISALQVSGH